jgi:hypothetical protein
LLKREYQELKKREKKAAAAETAHLRKRVRNLEADTQFLATDIGILWNNIKMQHAEIATMRVMAVRAHGRPPCGYAHAVGEAMEGL